MKKIYLAGPDVFRLDASEFGKKVKDVCSRYGFEGLWPLDNDIKGISKETTAKLIAEANMEMIRKCDYVIANLSPFRGPSADPGTVWECGFAKGLGKKVIGITNDTRAYKTKVLEMCRHDGMLIEDFCNSDNLMIVKSVDRLITFNGDYFTYTSILKNIKSGFYDI